MTTQQFRAVLACLAAGLGPSCTIDDSRPATAARVNAPTSFGAPGTPIVLAAHQINSGAIAVEGDRVYWANWHRAGTIQSVSRDGGLATIVVANQDAPGDIALSDDRVFWTRTLDQWESNVWATPLVGGAPEAVASGQKHPYRVVTDGAHLYWTNDDSVMRMPLRGGAPTVLAGGVREPSALTADGGTVYWTDEEKVMHVAVAGRSPKVFCAGQDDPRGITTDRENVYWVTYGKWLPDDKRHHGGVWKMPKRGGAPTLLASDQDGATAIAVDGSHVYWTEGETVNRIPIEGGAREILASAQQMPLYLVLDAENVYWTTTSYNGTEGTVMKLAK